MTNGDATDWDAQLDEWAASTLIWGEPAPLPEFADWLKTGSPDHWHDAALNWNWDYGLEPMWWIVTRVDCDAATALDVFYTADPFSPNEPSVRELIAYIRDRWIASGYQRSEIAYDAPRMLSRYETKADLENAPTSMRIHLSGRKVEQGNYADGLPRFLFDNQ